MRDIFGKTEPSAEASSLKYETLTNPIPQRK